jgi:transposase
MDKPFENSNPIAEAGQGDLLANTVRCVRFVYNYGLKLTADTWYWRQTRIGYAQTSMALDVLMSMKQYSALTKVPAAPLDNALKRLDEDFKSFYAGESPYPRFKTPDDFASGSYALLPAPRMTVRIKYPTETRCFDCGWFLNEPPTLPTWICPSCGVIQDTAENTARNAEAVSRAIRAYGAMLPPE